MAMTEKQINAVVKLFALCFVHTKDLDEKKKLYIQFNDNFGRSIGDWSSLALEKIKEQKNSSEAIDAFNKLASKEKEDLSENIEIRKVRRSDFEQIRELIRDEFSVFLTQYDEAGIQKYLNSEHSFVACNETEVVGVILAGEMPDVDRLSVYIDILAVATSMRGRGIGHKLYHAVTKVPSSRRSAARLILKTDKNRDAYEIYKHWGFSEEELTYMVQIFMPPMPEMIKDSPALKTRKDRIHYILDNYHPIELPGETKMSFDEAVRLIEIEISQGKTEEEAFDVLKFCTVGEDFIEE